MATTQVSFDKWLDNKDVVQVYREILLPHKTDEILPFATTGVDLESIMLSKISQTEKKKKSCDFTHMWDITHKPQMNERNITNIQTNKQLTDRKEYGGHQRRRGWEEVEEEKEGQIYGQVRRLNLGWWAHNESTVDILQYSTLETYTVLLNNLTAIRKTRVKYSALPLHPTECKTAFGGGSYFKFNFNCQVYCLFSHLISRFSFLPSPPFFHILWLSLLDFRSYPPTACLSQGLPPYDGWFGLGAPASHGGRAWRVRNTSRFH